MYEGLNSPSIHTPHSLQEYGQTAIRYPNVQIWNQYHDQTECLSFKKY